MPVRNTVETWGSVAKAFHWTIAVLIIGQFVLGVIAVNLPVGMEKLTVLARHKSVGITILGLAILRLAWRAANRVPAMPAGMTRWERLAARTTHAALYALLIVVPLAGWTMSSAKNFPVSWFGLVQLPDFVALDDAVYDRTHAMHVALAFTLGGIVVLHLVAALKHHFIDRDDVLRRMLPFVRIPALLGLLLAALLAPGGLSAAVPEPGKPATDWHGSGSSGTLRFQFNQAGAATTGAFNRFTVALAMAADGSPARLSVVVDVGSIDTQDKDRDAALRAPDIFDAGTFPQATFVADRIEHTGGNLYAAAGKLTIRGVSREVILPFLLARFAGDPPGWKIAGNMPINRLDYGVGQGEWRSTAMVGNAVTIEWSVRLTPGR